MSIATELTNLQTDITNARTAITNKGGTVTSGGGSSQLATDIATIPSGSAKPRYTYSGKTLSFLSQCCVWAETLGITGTKLLLLDTSTSTAGNNRCVCFMFVNGVGVSVNRSSLVEGNMTYKLDNGFSWSLSASTGYVMLNGSEFIEYDISEIMGE